MAARSDRNTLALNSKALFKGERQVISPLPEWESELPKHYCGTIAPYIKNRPKTMLIALAKLWHGFG
jgi:hypothetical protein